jgi:hypothetical protein
MKHFILISIIVSITFSLDAQKDVLTQDNTFFLPYKPQLPREFVLPDTIRFYHGDTIPNSIWEKLRREFTESEIKPFKSPIDQMPVIVPPNYNFSMIVSKPDSSVQYYIRNLNTGETKISPLKKLIRPK